MWSLTGGRVVPPAGYVECNRLSLQERQQSELYQKQLTALEAQNKSLTDELTHIKVS